MKMGGLGHRAASGAVWATIDKFGTMVLQFIVNLILARLLLPSDFGAIGMLAIFIAVSQVLIDGGFGSALIQKKSPTQTDFSTIFYWNLGFSTFLYLILFFCAPFISGFFSMPVLKGVLRGIGLTLITNAILSIQKVRLQKQLAFKTIAISNLSSYVVASGIGVGLAYYGGGVWSLVFMQVIYTILAVIVLSIITRWYPSLCFSKRTMSELFGFGGYLLAANILQEICRNIQGLIIGKRYSAIQLGYYSQAHKLDSIVSTSIPQIISQVMFPVFSNLQNEPSNIALYLDKTIRINAFITLPIIGGLIVFAEPIIQFLYGDKWLPCVPYYQIFCIGGFVAAFININFYVVAAMGKSKKLFYWSFYKWGILLTAIFIGMNFGVRGIVWGVVISNFNTYFVNAVLACNSLKISLWRQISKWGYILLIVVISMTVSYIIYNYYFKYPIIGLSLYLIIYFTLCIISNRKDIDIIIQLVNTLKTSR